MKPDDRSLDYPCPHCKASIGMPCTVALMSARVKELMERALPHPERSALARDASVGGVEPTAPAPSHSATTGSSRGRAGSLAMSEQDGIPTPSVGNVENRVAPKNDAASSSLSEGQVAYANRVRAECLPDADLFNEETASWEAS